MVLVERAGEGARYDGLDAARLAALLELPRVALYDSVSSTLDVAHTLGAAGAPAGTLVLADQQTAGRGRGGRQWSSASGAGIWLTLVERPSESSALDVMSLRIGLRAAPVLERWTVGRVALKWPNDLYTAGGKLGGVLVEVRWRAARVEWIAIGVGINVRAPSGIPGAAWLAEGSARCDVLQALVPALRTAAATEGPLSVRELQSFAERDLAVGRRCVAPAAGLVLGLRADGALLVRKGDRTIACYSGSLIFAEDA